MSRREEEATQPAERSGEVHLLQQMVQAVVEDYQSTYVAVMDSDAEELAGCLKSPIGTV